MTSLFPIILTKEILRRNVALTSFVSRITIVVVRGKMGITECTTLALEKECDDLVSAMVEVEALNVMEAS